jgi:hypothetical protein
MGGDGVRENSGSKHGSSLSERRLLIGWACVAAIAIAAARRIPASTPTKARNSESDASGATNDYIAAPRRPAVSRQTDGTPAAEAATMEVAGATEFAARFPAWLFAIATAALLAWFARRERRWPQFFFSRCRWRSRSRER